MAGSIQTWANPLPGAVSTDLELIFNSLTQWLSAPTFLNGVTVGNGTGIQTGDGAGVTTTLVNTNPSTAAPTDTSTPGTPVVTALGGVRSVLAFWPSITTANGSPVANYVAEISTVNTFVSLVQTLNPVGPVASFDNLVANTAYFVRVAAVSYVGNQGPWSATVSVTTPQIAAGDISANTITAGSAIIGTAAISSAQIVSLVADKITAGTINAQTIQLGASGGTAALQSTNYVTGTTGWAVKGDGSAEMSQLLVGPVASGHVVLSLAGGNGEVDIWHGPSQMLSLQATAVAGIVANTNFGSNITLDNGVAFTCTSGGNITLTGSLGTPYPAVGSANIAAAGQVPILQTVSATHTTDASGFIAVTWPTAFPNNIKSVVATMDDTLARYAVVSAVTTTGCNLRVVNGATSPDSALVSTTVTYHIIAVGT